jgi:hypothetical protein
MKWLLSIFSVLAMFSIAKADWLHNPYTGKPDYYEIVTGSGPTWYVTDNGSAQQSGGSVYVRGESGLSTMATGATIYVKVGAYIDFLEGLVPAAPPTDTLRIYNEKIKGFSFLKYYDDGGMKRQLIRDSMILVRNERGSAIAANRIVYASGSTTEVPLVDTAKADSISTLPAIGVTIETIADDAYGRVMQVGLLEGINTAALAEGDVLYVSDATAGVPTTTAPVSPSLTQEIGTVLVSDAAAGAIQIVARGLTGDEYGTAQDNFRFGSGSNPHTVISSIEGVSTFQVQFSDGTTLTTGAIGDSEIDYSGGTTISGVSSVIIEQNIFNPDDKQSGVSENIAIYKVDSDKYPRGIFLESIWIQQFGATDYAVMVEEWAGNNPSHDNDIENMIIAGDNEYLETRGTDIDHRIIEGGNWVFLDLPTTESDQLFVKIRGYAR